MSYQELAASWKRKSEHRQRMALKAVQEDSRLAFAHGTSKPDRFHIRMLLSFGSILACRKDVRGLENVPRETVHEGQVCGTCAMVAAGWLGQYNPAGERGV